MTAVSLHRFARRVADDRRAVAAVEFAIVVPVMLSLIMGLGELAYQGYVQSVLIGAVQKAGRDSTLQGGGAKTDSLDAAVVAQLLPLQGGLTKDCTANPATTTPTWCSSRKSYSSFLQIGAEPFKDTNGNNQYDKATECFTDTNGNGVWDADPGASGQGGANDVAVYSFTIRYPRIFPVFGLVGIPAIATLNSMTTLKNQPWATQTTYQAVQICPVGAS